MTIAEINADGILAKMLDNNIEVQTSSKESHKIRCYGDNERPNRKLGDEFIEIRVNGNIQSQTEPIGLFSGNLMMIVWCKTMADGRVKKNIVSQILTQAEQLIKGVSMQGYFFDISSDSVITPTTTNLTTGYSTTIINVEWHTTE